MADSGAGIAEADLPFEEMISGAERELEELCGRYDYRQLLFPSRLCTGVPLLRDADADMAAVRGASRTPTVGSCGAGTGAWTTIT